MCKSVRNSFFVRGVVLKTTIGEQEPRSMLMDLGGHGFEQLTMSIIQ